MTKQTLVLEFQTSGGKLAKLNVPDPKMPTDDTAIQAAMDLIVARNIFTFPTGAIERKVQAYVSESSTTAVG